MKKLSLLTFFLVGCSSLTPHGAHHRNIASMQAEGSVKLDLSLNQPVVLASGADVVYLTITPSIPVQAAQLKIIVDGLAVVGPMEFKGGSYTASIRPNAKSPSLKLVVLYKDQISEVLEVETTIKPRTNKMLGTKSDFVSKKFINGLTYLRKEKSPPGQQDGFSVTNIGTNAIVSEEESQRAYDFAYDEQAAQNLSLMISDIPNGTVSHTMHTHFMFFPRTFIPIGEVNKDEQVTVTLPNGEEILFDKSGEIIGGIFKEGPVDYTPDRFKRTYANLKYQGKGILLRANARGQMPQQGQFEATKIDMEYGIKYSSDVLIINGTTGQRCRRPKVDFWSAADVSPILFNFPSDKEFDTYLKAKCGFGIPDLKLRTGSESVNYQAELDQVWSKCESASDMKSCLSTEADLIEDKAVRAKVKFESLLKSQSSKEDEKKKIPLVIEQQIKEISSALLADTSWKALGCFEKSLSLVKDELKFHDTKEVMKVAIAANCAKIVGQVSHDPSTAPKTVTNTLPATLPLKVLPPVPTPAPIAAMPLPAGLTEKVYATVIADLEIRADAKAKSCLSEFPMDTMLSKVKFKLQREACLTDAWSELEAQAIKKAKSDPAVKKAGVSSEGISSRLAADRRRLQLKLMKKYFIA